jgi:probable addiction module antidote protein
MSRKFQTWEEFMIETLKDPAECIGQLEIAIEEYQKDGDTKALMRTIEYIAKAQGGITKLAKDAKINRENLYKLFSYKTSPRLDTMTKILQALGFSLCIQPVQAKS